MKSGEERDYLMAEVREVSKLPSLRLWCLLCPQENAALADYAAAFAALGCSFELCCSAGKA